MIVVEEEVELLSKFYQIMQKNEITFADPYRWIESGETRIVESLKSKFLLLPGKSKESYHLSNLAIDFLVSFGRAEEVHIILHDFLTSYDEKVEWKDDEVVIYVKENRIDKWEFEMAIKYGEMGGFVSKQRWMGMKYGNLTITVDGVTYANNPTVFVDYRQLHKWCYRHFITKLKFKLRQQGFESHHVVAVGERNTSKTCSRCFSQHTTRSSQGRFVCRQCNYELNADLNGARNIAKRLITYILHPSGKFKQYNSLRDYLSGEYHDLKVYGNFHPLGQWLKYSLGDTSFL